MSTKRDLLNYLGFLQESGFLYMEGLDAEELFGSAASPRVVAAPVIPAPAAARPRPPTKPAPVPPVASPPPAPFPTPLADKPASAPLCREEKIARLTALTAEAESCRACPLGATRNKLVFSEGDPDARIVIVGEGPGADEDEQGLPFVGRSGQLLNKMLAAIGFKREDVYICNTVKCRPPGNRDPFPSEKNACERFLVAQLEIIRPQMIIALGAHAAQYLCRSELSIGKLRGKWHTYHGIPLLATYHPAFLLRSASFKPQSWEDFKLIHQKYTELNPDNPRKIWQKEA